MELFEENTKNLLEYTIQDVSQDGACLYRCMARFIYDNYDNLEDIIQRNSLTKIVDIIQLNKGKDYSWYIETDLAKELQQILVEWLINHNEDYVENQNCHIRDLIELCHEMEFDNYIELYKIFAGDNDFYLVETGKTYVRGKNRGQPICEKICIPTRWGGFPEEYAFHKIFDVNLNIYILRKYDKKTERIVKANSFKNARLSLISNIGDTGYLDADFLLLERKANHYMYLNSTLQLLQ